MKPGEAVVFAYIYLALGITTTVCMVAGGELPGDMEDDWGREHLAVVVFWPLFVVKYLLWGIWILLSTGFDLLV